MANGLKFTRVGQAVLMTVAAVALVSGCQSSATAPVTEPAPITESADYTIQMPNEDAAVAFADELLAGNLTEDDAVARISESGFTYRVVARDGDVYPATADYSPTRLNLFISEGVVVDVLVG